MNRLALPITGLLLLVVGALVTAGMLEILAKCTAPERFNVCF
jgi:hypothetical protein